MMSSLLDGHLTKIVLVVLVATVVRWCVSLNSHSGQGKPPMFGDYEAQRHWMEITVNLPPKEWYFNSSANDLQYWGLDYPPLTAYHSWLCGMIAKFINPEWVALYSSRGVDNPTHKLFMRSTVLVADFLVFFPAVFAYFLYTDKIKFDKDRTIAILCCFLYPGIILIDHGHFQYNGISLGLTVLAVVFLSTDHDLLGSMAFSLALNYKQMELYHAMPFFCYLMGKCLTAEKENWFFKLAKIGIVVISTFFLCWLPFLTSAESALQVLHRLFPFARGLYEDKVSNFWCTLSLVVKLRQMMSREDLVVLCGGTTLAALLPSSINLLRNPTIDRFKLALVNSSMVFFLFSFQVHEKSILIAAIPVCLLLHERPFPCFWFLLISTFSMFPLLVMDGLVVATIATGLLYFTIATSNLDFGPYTSYFPGNRISVPQERNDVRLLIATMFWLSLLGSVVLAVASLTLTPPKKLPDLFPVLISAYSCCHFVLFTLYFHWWQFTCSSSETMSKHRVSARNEKKKRT
ncbi:dolichyl pyrophosphate Man9GlcNAc2 alpha-1,3-glucosyltransferase isoform X2 [Lingula anatina]|uniref:Alpha-1,3-glucosyltransferase n=1 Tax=Lingula anatina TaxID=7574 RepID=A0A1S3HGL8_LINAN|nr:dolichyl pyrophosphate Man9GlcNAc2 alpha-1,3-glucosyltransferase isoform X2 [Lingula anatina]|eukprot:XP_013384169.1 dolichyl pyrophosphate Man9GlcNAc2 alpha-1,3-glucosyltransferase isoform X2 [Lingula anatina]